MAEEVKFSKLKAYLQGLPKNTSDTPYEINVVDYKKRLSGRSYKSFGKV